MSPPPDAEQDLAVERNALTFAKASALQSDWRSAIRLASLALVRGLSNELVVAFFDEVIRASPDPLELSTVPQDQIDEAAVAARARVLGFLGNVPGATTLALTLARRKPAQPYLRWIEEWWTPDVLAAAGRDVLQGSLLGMIQLLLDVPEHPEAGDPRLANVRAAAAVLRSARTAWPMDPSLYAAECMLLRRLGDPANTLATAFLAERRFPADWATQTSLVHALGDAGRLDEAVVHARRALELNPADGSPLHDLALLFYRAGARARARELFAELLSAFPEYPLSNCAKAALGE